jgi:hypothetical protein
MKALNDIFSMIAIIFLLFGELAAQRTKYVVIAVLDGARYTETFGDSTHTYIPKIWNELRPIGTIYTSYYNNGKTETNPGHSSILSGTWQNILNEGSERPHSPTIFEYYRKQKNASAVDCWVALGKDKLNILSYSTNSDYGSAYAASVRTSTDVGDDTRTWENTRYVLKTYRSKLTIANFAKIDIDGHAGVWEDYLSSIRRADSLVAELWNVIQKDSVLKNKTTMIVTNDHGRHTDGFSSHGDGCEGCRHIMLLVAGPDTPKDVVDNALCSQVDIAPTIGAMMRFSTPISIGTVIESAVAARMNVPLVLKSPPAAKVSGTVSLQWSAGTVKDSMTTYVEYSSDAGASWKSLFTSSAKDTVYDWNTLSVSDGTRNLVRVQVFGDTTYGMAQTQQPFTIDNPGNGAPDVVILSPNRNIIVTGNEKIQWFAADAEGDPLHISISGSIDSGVTWQSIAVNLTNSGIYDWNSALSANSKASKVKITCSDGALSSYDVSILFEVSNARPKISSIKQIAGTGNGAVTVNIGDPVQLTGHIYRVTINEVTTIQKYYNVFDATKNSFVLNNIPIVGDGSSEGPMFDGIRLAILDYQEPVNNPDSTRWTKGNSTLSGKIILPEIQFLEGMAYGIPEAADYEIRIANSIVDTSRDYFSSAMTPLYFTVYNITENRKMPIIFSELVPDGKISFGDDLFLLRKDSASLDAFTWEVFITGKDTNINPEPGDIFKISILKPLTKRDIFEFTAIPTGVEQGRAIPARFSLSQNYPNPFNPVTTISFTIPEASHVTLAIYDILGRRVSTLVNEKYVPGFYHHRWNAGTISSGVYFYRMTAVSLGGGKKEFFSDVKKLLLLK